MTPPVKAPTKLTIETDLDQRHFNIKTIPALSKMQDIQRWYNVLHARGRLCGVYTTPWEAFTKSSYMGTTWSLAFLDQAVMDREYSMSAALHGLLSAHEMFIDDCKELTHMIMNSGGNGYHTLYQIARLAHPLLGQVTAQKEQPQHRKSQSFAEHISYYLDYFQSEACSSRHYILNERVLLILEIHATGPTKWNHSSHSPRVSPRDTGRHLDTMVCRRKHGVAHVPYRAYTHVIRSGFRTRIHYRG
jgi:hypothetical protein